MDRMCCFHIQPQHDFTLRPVPFFPLKIRKTAHAHSIRLSEVSLSSSFSYPWDSLQSPYPDLEGIQPGKAIPIQGTVWHSNGNLEDPPISYSPCAFGRFSIRLFSGILGHETLVWLEGLLLAGLSCSWHPATLWSNLGKTSVTMGLSHSPNNQVVFTTQPEDHLFQHCLGCLSKIKVPGSHPVLLSQNF